MSSGRLCRWPRPLHILSRSTFPDASQQWTQPNHPQTQLPFSVASVLLWACWKSTEARLQVSSQEGSKWKGNGMGCVLIERLCVLRRHVARQGLLPQSSVPALGCSHSPPQICLEIATVLLGPAPHPRRQRFLVFTGSCVETLLKYRLHRSCVHKRALAWGPKAIF